MSPFKYRWIGDLHLGDGLVDGATGALLAGGVKAREQLLRCFTFKDVLLLQGEVDLRNVG